MITEEYKGYLASSEWRERRNACVNAYEYHCQVCGCTSWRRAMEVHHLHYKNVGNEKPEDLVLLCIKHHIMLHNNPDGYDIKTLNKLQRNCTEYHGDDPPPKVVREQKILTDAHTSHLAELMGRRRDGEMVDNSEIETAKIEEPHEFSSSFERASDVIKKSI